LGKEMTLRPVTRALTQKELRFLKNQRTALKRRRCTLWQRSVFAYVGIFGVLAILTLWAEGKNPHFILGFWGILGGLITVPGFIQEWFRLSKKITAYDYAIFAGQCEDFTVLARRMWEFEEQEDEGACYAFELATGGVVFVVGQDYYASERFPNADFSIIEFRDRLGRVLDMTIEKRGKKIAPEQMIASKEKESLEIPEHYSFFEGTLEEVYAKLKKA
jgi:hypothetical protein